MTNPLITYLQDHLAGANFAINLLGDLGRQQLDLSVAQLAVELLTEIEADRTVVEKLLHNEEAETSPLKEVVAWVAEKSGRLKLDLREPLGIFEAVEVLSLGVLGKLALWSALEVIGIEDEKLTGTTLGALKENARSQHQRLEAARLSLASAALLPRTNT